MFLIFFFNDTATTEIYTLSLHDALPIFRRYRAPSRYASSIAPCALRWSLGAPRGVPTRRAGPTHERPRGGAHRAHAQHGPRSEEHTSELQSRQYLVCRLLLEKKKK